jgi:Ca-activated chloride channel homolog
LRQLPALLAASLVTASIATAQVGTDPSLVYVHVSATNNRGQYITELRKEHFKILEDDKLQEIVYFSPKDVAISVGIVVDARGDVKDRIKATATAAFLTKDSSPQDQLFVAEPGDTPLNDALIQGLNKVLQLRNNTRALILFTDRTNTGSYPFSKIKELLRDQDVQFYAIATSQPEADVLRDLAQLSGGNSYFPSSIASVEGIYKKIALELRNQYVIGYRPTNKTQDGKWRKIKVSVELKDVKQKVHKFITRVKPGYYAPTVAGSSSAKN